MRPGAADALRGAVMAPWVPLGAVAATVVAVSLAARRRPSSSALAVIALACAWSLARAPALHWWDEFVWLGKARFAAEHGPAMLWQSADPARVWVPAGYPPGWPFVVGALALGRGDLASLVPASAAALLACVALYALALDSLGARWRAPLATAWLLATPLVAVHLRGAYVDLPLGLLAASAAVWLESSPLLAALTLAALPVMKDEGLAHAAAVLVAAAAGGLDRRRVAALALASAAPWALWRAALLARGGRSVDHAWSGLALTRLPALAVELARHATDLRTWGVFWAAPLVLAAWRSSAWSARSRRVAATAALQLGLLLAGVLAAPPQVMEFVRGGTVLNRVLLQLAPTVALLALCRALDARGGVPSAGEPAAVAHGEE